MINIKKLNPFGKMCVSMGMIPTSYKESLTYEEQLLWFCNYLKTVVIPAVNNNADAVEELQNLFNQLQSYVENYFDNLDVQEEINNKLDEMAESGELTDIIAQYLGLAGVLAYDTVADMKSAENIANGSKLKTFGYHSVNDGGSATYIARQVTNEDIIDEATIIALNNENLVAELIIENSQIAVEVFGAYGDDTHDDTQAIQKCIDYCTTKRLVCFFNNKVYKTTEPLEIKEVSVLCGGVTNDEYNTLSRIKNTTSDMITINSNIVGAKIMNLCFISDKTKELYFLHESEYTLEWCEMSHCGFREFYKVFDCFTLGCRFSDLYISYGKMMGTLHGSDNTIEDCFVSSPLATSNEDLLTLDGYSLSRFSNVYFTGKVDNNTGCNNILKIGSYSNNLSFDGCYFDFSNGSAIDILGGGGNFPESGASNISFNNCLFRGNCCNQETVTHIINANYCRNLNIINCSFNTTERYTINSNSKIYNLGQYCQGTLLLNNLYINPFSYNGSYISQASMIEPYDNKFNLIGIQDYSNSLILRTLQRTRKIFYKQVNATSGSTYGDITIPFDENMGDNPVVMVSVNNSVYTVGINNVTSNNVQVILRRIDNGSAVLNQGVTLNVIAISN